MKPLARQLALAAVSVAVGLLISEVALRVFEGASAATDRRGLHEPRPDRPWLYGLRPGAQGTLPVSGEIPYRINADGFRDRDHPREKPEGVFRIAVLGDSVTFGYGVALEDAFTSRLQEAIAGALPDGPAVEVLNLGVSGYNPYTEAALLDDVGARYAPDLVLVQFCINDLNDPTLHFDAQTRLRLGAIPDAAYPDPSLRRAPPRPPGALSRACRHSRVCARIDAAVMTLRAREPLDAERRAAGDPVTRDGPEWRWLERQYLRLAQTSRELGAGFAVLAFPYRAQLEEPGPHPVERRLDALARRNGWARVELLGAFRSAARRGTPLFLDGWHPTREGHRLAAEEIAAQLACRGLLPAAARSLCQSPETASRGPRTR